MTTKAGIIERLGDTAVLLPDLLSDALTANDRVKYLLALLQNAALHTAQPQRPASALCAERVACGVDDETLDDVVENSASIDDDTIRVPRATAVRARIFDEIARMIAPDRSGAARLEPRRGRRVHGAVARLGGKAGGRRGRSDRPWHDRALGRGW